MIEITSHGPTRVHGNDAFSQPARVVLSDGEGNHVEDQITLTTRAELRAVVDAGLAVGLLDLDDLMDAAREAGC